MPGAKHSSLNALSPSNYRSVRRKRSQRLPDPSDPLLNVEIGTGSPAPPPSRVRQLMGKIAAYPTPTPHPFLGDQKVSAPQLVPFHVEGESSPVSLAGPGLPCCQSPTEIVWTFSSSSRWTESVGARRHAGRFSAIRDFTSLLYMQARMDCKLPSFF